MNKELTRIDVENQCDLLATVGIDMLVQVSISRAWRDHDAAQRATIQQLEARIVQLETDVDRMAWTTSPASAQATIDQLVQRNDQLEARVKELEIDGEEYRQYAMDEVRKACQEAGVLVAADDSISISKAGDIAMKVKQLQARVKEVEALYADSCSAMNAHMEIHAQVVNRVKELNGLLVKWIYMTDMGLPLEDVIVMGEKLLIKSKAAVALDTAHDSA